MVEGLQPQPPLSHILFLEHQYLQSVKIKWQSHNIFS